MRTRQGARRSHLNNNQPITTLLTKLAAARKTYRDDRVGEKKALFAYDYDSGN